MGSNPTLCTTDKPTAHHRIFSVLWQLRKNGYAESTVETVSRRLRHLAECVCLDEPENVKGFIATAECSSSFKGNMVNAYSHYAVFHGLAWDKPQYQRAYSIRKLPLESDINLIVGCAKTRSRVAFRLVKECGLRPVEVSRLMVKQFDLHGGMVYPETAKGGEARVLQLNGETLALLKHLIAATSLSFTDRVFPDSKVLQTNWTRMRNRVAERLGKPELRQIRLYDLRHYYGTMLYRKTKDLVYVQRKMGHRSIKNTLIYIDLVDSKEDEFICKVAATVKEASELVQSGFEYVTEMDGVKLFRKRK